MTSTVFAFTQATEAVVNHPKCSAFLQDFLKYKDQWATNRNFCKTSFSIEGILIAQNFLRKETLASEIEKSRKGLEDEICSDFVTFYHRTDAGPAVSDAKNETCTASKLESEMNDLAVSALRVLNGDEQAIYTHSKESIYPKTLQVWGDFQSCTRFIKDTQNGGCSE